MNGAADTRIGTDEATAKPRRGQWTAQQKRRAVADSRAVGASVNEVARRHGVRPSLLSAWRRQDGKAKVAAKAQFAAVRVSAPPVATQGSIEIDFTGGCVRVCGIVDGAMLREVLAAAR